MTICDFYARDFTSVSSDIVYASLLNKFDGDMFEIYDLYGVLNLAGLRNYIFIPFLLFGVFEF